MVQQFWENSLPISLNVQCELTYDLAILSFDTVFKFLQSCPTLCNSMDSNLPGCSVHGIL